MIIKKQDFKPEILAPAGNLESFFAAIAAGADSIYCSLKNFSARMEADNFSIEELSKLSKLADKKGIKIYLAVNNTLKDHELEKVGRMLVRLKKYAAPYALIVNDLAMADLLKASGLKAELHLSTLSAFSTPSSFELVKQLGFTRVVLPREFNIDQIKMMAENSSGVELEAFIHGALCYGLSGRCYWSSWLGGKSGLRGRCVQPCRRTYTQGAEKKGYFSCMDLGLDVLVNVLQKMEEVKAWKIEGRKKTPHYVYYTVWGYKSLRDEEKTAKEKKETVRIFEQALGRPLSHYNFLPQRAYNPADQGSETGSGKFVGRIKNTGGKFFLEPWEPLFKGDKIRVGYEDDDFHSVVYVPTSIPKGGKFVLRHKDFNRVPPSKTPAFLIDRKEKELLSELAVLEEEFNNTPAAKTASVNFKLPSLKQVNPRKFKQLEVFVKRVSESNQNIPNGVWVDNRFIKIFEKKKKRFDQSNWFWLPPFIWPEEEKKYIEIIESIINAGGVNFVVNSPWHASLFRNIKRVNAWGGPFCNISNSHAADVMARIGFKGVIVSPELTKEEILALPRSASLPLGIVIKGYFPFTVSAVVSDNIKKEKLFLSPKKEGGFVRQHDSLYWVYPSWELDIKDKKDLLKKAGYSLFCQMQEQVPKEIFKEKRKSSQWNWDLTLL